MMAGLTHPPAPAYRSEFMSSLPSPVRPSTRSWLRPSPARPGALPWWRLLLLLAALQVGGKPHPARGNPPPPTIEPLRLVEAARRQIGVTVGYDPEYRVLSYPGGDVPKETGVCTDVLTRALRAQGVDLQQAVHEDMQNNFARYPHPWGLKAPDANIDHRRVPNLMCFFTRRGYALPVTTDPGDYRPGDVVAWNLGGAITHIGVVSDLPAGAKRPRVIHNIGRGAQEEDILFTYRIIGHYRLP